MSIVYSLISRFPDIVLCEHSDFTGNFMQLSRVILQKAVKPESKYSIDYDKYKIHYINENKITYLCLSDGMPDQNAFAFLQDIKKKLLQKHNYDKLVSMSTYQLPEFQESLKQYMNYYNTHPLTTKAGELISELNAAKDVTVANIEKLIERENKITIIATKSENLKSSAMNISTTATTIRKNEERKRNQLYLIIAVGVIVLLLLLYFVF